jgi:hypothetical protein
VAGSGSRVLALPLCRQAVSTPRASRASQLHWGPRVAPLCPSGGLPPPPRARIGSGAGWYSGLRPFVLELELKPACRAAPAPRAPKTTSDQRQARPRAAPSYPHPRLGGCWLLCQGWGRNAQRRRPPLVPGVWHMAATGRPWPMADGRWLAAGRLWPIYYLLRAALVVMTYIAQWPSSAASLARWAHLACSLV